MNRLDHGQSLISRGANRWTGTGTEPLNNVIKLDWLIMNRKVNSERKKSEGKIGKKRVILMRLRLDFYLPLLRWNQYVSNNGQ